MEAPSGSARNVVTLLECLDFMRDPGPRFVLGARSFLKEATWQREAVSPFSFENTLEVLVDLPPLRVLAHGVAQGTLLPKLPLGRVG